MRILSSLILLFLLSVTFSPLFSSAEPQSLSLVSDVSSQVKIWGRYPLTRTVQEMEMDLGIRHKTLSADPENALPWSTERPYLRKPKESNTTQVRAFTWNQSYAAFYRLLTIVSYDDPQSILHWTCYSCRNTLLKDFNLTYVIHDPVTDTLAFTGTMNGQFYSVFRGSDNIMNFIEDLEVWKPNQPLDGIPNVYTAEGFYNCFHNLQNNMYTAILATLHSYPSYPINFIGHSLGGAVASIFALDFAYNMKLKVQSYTFGCPRVGNQAFVETYESLVSDYWRMVNTFDPVPHVPPNLFNFLHFSHEVWQYNPKGIYIQCNWNLDEDPSCSKSVTNWLIKLAISDHRTYLNISNDPASSTNRANGANLASLASLANGANSASLATSKSLIQSYMNFKSTPLELYQSNQIDWEMEWKRIQELEMK